MKRLILTTLFTASLLSGLSAFGAQVSVGIQIGQPPPPRVLRVRPASPGPDYAWVEGYWYPVGNHWKWHQGYWTRAPYAGARWLAPRYEGGHFYEGYWEGDRGRMEHNHAWDKHRERDYRGDEHDRDHDHDHR